MHLRDHAAGRRRIGQLRHPADLVEPQPDQGFPLAVVAARGAPGLLNLDGLAGTLAHSLLHHPLYSTACSPSAPSRRRACSADTLMLRRAATERGESCRLSASKVARTMLYGLDEPMDFATTSCMPSVSNTARMGPPAIMPVPAGAARR